MKSIKVALRYLINKRHEIYGEIIKAYKDAAKGESFVELIKYVESLYRSHIKAKINIETLNLKSEEIRHQIDIRENNLEFMSSALLEKFSLDETTKIMSLYRELAKRETELHKLSKFSGASYFKRRKIVKEVYKEMKEEEETLQK